jgi:tetratricopeptide (TPR) repeat protein
MGVESRLKQASSDFGMEARREARTSFSRAWDLSVEYVRRQPGDGEQVAGLARLGEMIEARRIKTDTKDAVESALRFLTDRAPRSYTAWTLLGREHAKRGHLTQAAAAFQRAAERYPLNPRAWLRVGDAAVFFDAERAIAAYARAMEVNRVVSDENTSLFAMLWSSRPVRPARPDQLVRLEARAESVECVFRGGLMIWEVGGFVDAAAKFGRALEMKPGDPQLAAFRALVLKLEALRIEDEAVSIAAKAAWDEFEVIQASAPESLRLPDRLMELFRTRSRAMRVSARGERL